ncbi:MAG: hypothetical protein ACOYYS_19740 [Chloroflexota bacterium]
MSEATVSVDKKLYDVTIMPVWSRLHGREFTAGETIELRPFDAAPLLAHGLLKEHDESEAAQETAGTAIAGEDQEISEPAGITPVLEEEPAKPRRKKE